MTAAAGGYKPYAGSGRRARWWPAPSLGVEERGRAHAPAGERRLELLLRGPSAARGEAGGGGPEGGRHAEPFAQRGTCGAGGLRRRRHDVEAAPGAAQRRAFRGGRLHGAGAEPAADPA